MGMRAVRTAGTLLAAAGGAAFAQPGLGPPPGAHFAAAAQAIPFELFRNQRIFLDGTIDGHRTTMMLDSGAAMTVVDRAFAQTIGLRGSRSIQVQGAAAPVQGEVASGVTLEAGGLHLAGTNVLILDMSSVERGIGRPIPVLLGRDAFKAGIVSIDFPRRRILFADRAGFRPPAGASRLALSEHGRLPVVTIAIAGEPVPAQIDLGNGGTMVVSNQAWTSRPKLAALRHAAGQVGGVGGMKPSRNVTLPSVSLGTTRFADVPATLNEDARSLPMTGANIGVELLKPFVVTFDLAGGALYLEGSARSRPFDRDRAGARFELAGDRLDVAFVSPDGPAAAAGLKAGDRIVAVEGRPVDPHYYDRPDWTRGPAGHTVTLERADGSRVKVELADYY